MCFSCTHLGKVVLQNPPLNCCSFAHDFLKRDLGCYRLPDPTKARQSPAPHGVVAVPGRSVDRPPDSPQATGDVPTGPELRREGLETLGR